MRCECGLTVIRFCILCCRCCGRGGAMAEAMQFRFCSIIESATRLVPRINGKIILICTRVGERAVRGAVVTNQSKIRLEPPTYRVCACVHRCACVRATQHSLAHTHISGNGGGGGEDFAVFVVVGAGRVGAKGSHARLLRHQIASNRDGFYWRLEQSTRLSGIFNYCVHSHYAHCCGNYNGQSFHGWCRTQG